VGEGWVVGDPMRWPWHPGCCDLRSGEALAARALSPLTCWQVEERDGKIIVGTKKDVPPPKQTGSASEHVVIVGGGAAGFAAAEVMRRRRVSRRITMLSHDTAA